MHMLRTLLVSIVTALALAAPAALAAPRPAGVTLAECLQDGAAATRGAGFAGEIRRIAGAERLAMRFTLQARGPGTRGWETLAAPGWGAWETSNPGVGKYVYTKRVVNLAGPAAYRAVVRFKWIAAGGHVLARRMRRSPACRQPDPRPDLRVIALTSAPGIDAATSRYLVRVRNAGRQTAPASDVALSIGRTLLPPVALAPLGPDEAATVEVVAPACLPRDTLVAHADAAGAVAESAERNNALRRRCAELG